MDPARWLEVSLLDQAALGIHNLHTHRSKRAIKKALELQVDGSEATVSA